MLRGGGGGDGGARRGVFPGGRVRGVPGGQVRVGRRLFL